MPDIFTHIRSFDLLDIISNHDFLYFLILIFNHLWGFGVLGFWGFDEKRLLAAL